MAAVRYPNRGASKTSNVSRSRQRSRSRGCISGPCRPRNELFKSCRPRNEIILQKMTRDHALSHLDSAVHERRDSRWAIDSAVCPAGLRTGTGRTRTLSKWTAIWARIALASPPPAPTSKCFWSVRRGAAAGADGCTTLSCRRSEGLLWKASFTWLQAR